MTKSGKHCGKKGEIARFVQFLFCHYVFKKSSAAEASESVYMRERVKEKNSKTLWNNFFTFKHLLSLYML